MLTVWYLVATLGNGAVALPQVDHSQCVKNREWIMNTRNSFGKPYCIEGAAGLPPMVSTGKSDDD